MQELPVRIGELRLRADPTAWAAAGFEVDGDRTQIGTVPVRFGALTGWTLHGPRSAELDGLPTELGDRPPPDVPASEHPNGAVAIDHVVVFTAELERTIAAFEEVGIRCRRLREVGPPERQLRQAFFRLGEVICEAVQVPADQAGTGGSARFWGLTVTVADLERVVADLGPERVGTIRDAVQPGRRIATVRRAAGLGLPVALITPGQRSGSPARP